MLDRQQFGRRTKLHLNPYCISSLKWQIVSSIDTDLQRLAMLIHNAKSQIYISCINTSSTSMPKLVISVSLKYCKKHINIRWINMDLN